MRRPFYALANFGFHNPTVKVQPDKTENPFRPPFVLAGLSACHGSPCRKTSPDRVPLTAYSHGSRRSGIFYHCLAGIPSWAKTDTKC